MQKYMHFFPASNEYMEFADASRYDVQEVMKRAAMLITDYSSVFFDMLYMKKPVVFYQFDYEKFREAQYGEGYFRFGDNPFGRSIRERQAVFDELERIIGEGFRVDERFLEAHRDYFRLYDADNSERVYRVVGELRNAAEGKGT